MLRQSGSVGVEELADAFRRHAADDPTRPQRTERGQGAGARARRRDDRLRRRQSRLRGAPARRPSAQAPDRRGGGAPRARQRLAADQHRHDHRGSREGARRPFRASSSSPTIFMSPTSFTATSRSQVIITGGSIRQGDGGIVGAVTVAQIEQFRVDMAIIGTSAIDPDGTLLDFDVHEVQISRAIIEHARKIVLVADSSKFSRSAPVKIAHTVGDRCFRHRSPAIGGDRRNVPPLRRRSDRGRRRPSKPKTASCRKGRTSVTVRYSFFSLASFKMFVVASFSKATAIRRGSEYREGRRIARRRVGRASRLSMMSRSSAAASTGAASRATRPGAAGRSSFAKRAISPARRRARRPS